MKSHAAPSLDNIVVSIPCYNAQATIGNTLQNTLEQTHKDFHVLVYDDGSTDTSPDIVKSFADRDSRVVLHRNEENKGRPQARNALLHLADGGLLAWQDADDLWHPEKVAKQVAFYDALYQEHGHEKFALVSSLERRKPDDGVQDDAYLEKVLGADYYGTLHPPKTYDARFICSDRYMAFPFYLQSTFCRAQNFIDAGGFDHDLPWYEELDMGLKLLGSGTQIFGLQNEDALAYYFSGAPRLAPEAIAECLLQIYRNNGAFLTASGIDVEYDISLRRLTLFFLGMIRKQEFGAAMNILSAEQAYAMDHPELEQLLMHNLELLKVALRAAQVTRTADEMSDLKVAS